MTSVLAKIQSFTSRFTREDEGASAVEYGLLVGLIAVAIIVAVTLLGTNLTAMFNNIATSLNPTTTG